jgi:putative oxygen-independent coproporphyrinogen III oxidase
VDALAAELGRAPAARAHALPPLSLYVHFPWCVRKCPYCDFNSHTLQGALPERRYLGALLTDLTQEAAAVRGRGVLSIFFGGGTPSLFAPQSLAQLLESIGAELMVAADAEITLEANPGTIERGRFADYRAAGVTRVSLGAQSFSDAQLRRLGRIHSAAETRRAVEELHAAGLTNFNLDLMYGLPGQSIPEAVADVDAALALGPAHVSHYQLTLEPGTVFAGRPPAGLPDADSCADMQQACRERLAAAGLLQYEVSGYAREGARCRHNLNYWYFGDYLGIGAGAHGKCSRSVNDRLMVERTEKVREPRRYLAAAAAGRAGTRHTVPERDLPFEYLMNALRLTEGFDKKEFEARTGLGFEATAPILARPLRLGLLECAGTRWRASARGADLLNELLAELLPET